MKCRWKQHFHYASGAFFEELVNDDMHVWWGYDGKKCVWEVDFSGLPSVLELDDMETSLLCTWIRNGIWLMPEIRQKLHITLAENGGEEPKDWQLLREQSFASTSSQEQAAAGNDENNNNNNNNKNKNDRVVVEVQLKEGKVKARLEVCTKTWLPLHLTLPVCGDIEKTTYNDFDEMYTTPAEAAATRRNAKNKNKNSSSSSSSEVTGGGLGLDVIYPKHTIQVASGGGQNEYWAKECYLKDVEEEDVEGQNKNKRTEEESDNQFEIDVFRVPHVPLFPPDTSFDMEAGREIDYFQSRSGHIVVKPKINGKDFKGMMILDTGASGFVITKKLADDLELSAFGELYVAGVTHKVRSQFRRANTIQLGPVCMENPLFMEMNIDGVVHGSPEPIVGILGYDFFRRCVVEMPPLQDNDNVVRSGLIPSSYYPKPEKKKKIVVHDPAEYNCELGGDNNVKCQDDKGLVWQQLQLVANVPHITATFRKDNGNEHSALFMLDSGAGGAGIMFHARASEEYELLDPAELQSLSNTKSIRGIGGESSAGGMKVFEGNMSYLQVSGARFENVLSLIAMGGGFDLSLHTAGMICADLMVQCRVIFDYPRRRFAMVQEDED